jgi:hypothetical protein
VRLRYTVVTLSCCNNRSCTNGQLANDNNAQVQPQHQPLKHWFCRHRTTGCEITLVPLELSSGGVSSVVVWKVCLEFELLL